MDFMKAKVNGSLVWNDMSVVYYDTINVDADKLVVELTLPNSASQELTNSLAAVKISGEKLDAKVSDMIVANLKDYNIDAQVSNILDEKIPMSVYADYDLSYEFNLGSLYDAISSGDIEFSLNGRVVTFKRNATHDALGALEGNLYFKVIDSKTQKEFYIPFDFGEITNETEHDWGEVVYEWSEDGTKLTATRVCKNNKNHVETETVNVVS